MCLAIPARIIKIEQNIAEVDMAGVRRNADVRMLSDVAAGDYVLIHAGFAIERIKPEEAKKSLDIWKQIDKQME